MFSTEANLSKIKNRRIDAEYYDPVIWQRLMKIAMKTESLSRYIETPFRNPMCYGFKYINKEGVPFIRIDNLCSPHIDYSNIVYISKEVHDRFASTKLNKHDILMGVRGNTIGRLGVYLGKDGQANFSPNVIRLRPKNPNFSPFIAFYLASNFGQRLISRETSGTGQPTITSDLIQKIQVIKIDECNYDYFKSLYEKYFNAVEETKKYYNQAQHLLESELGLDKLSFQKPVGYTARFSELELSRRLDAQHFQPRFEQLIHHLSGFSSERVRDICTYNRRGLQPFYVEDGPVSVVNSQHLGPHHIDYDGLEKTSEKAFALCPEGHIRQNDLLIYTTGAYIGRTNVFLSNQPALASNHVNILRLNSGIDAAYMALVFQSTVGQSQTQKHARGSAQAELYPTDIDRFIVPMLSPSKQAAIGDLVRDSLVKQQESKRLLDQAKTRVEQLIEEAAAQ